MDNVDIVPKQPSFIVNINDCNVGTVEKNNDDWVFVDNFGGIWEASVMQIIVDKLEYMNTMKVYEDG